MDDHNGRCIYVGITVPDFRRGSSALSALDLCTTQNGLLFHCRRMCDLLDDPCALVSGPRKSQQGESLGIQLGELAHLIVMFIYLVDVTIIHYHTIISIRIDFNQGLPNVVEF
jgi:hypothetical protein